MGLNASFNVEVRSAGGWHWAGEIRLRRRFEVIERLGLIKPSTTMTGPCLPLRGLPAGLSVIARARYDGDQGAAFTWFTLEELETIAHWHLTTHREELEKAIDLRPGFAPEFSLWLQYMIEKYTSPPWLRSS